MTQVKAQNPVTVSEIQPEYTQMEWSHSAAIHCEKLPSNKVQAHAIMLEIFTYDLRDAASFQPITNEVYAGIMVELKIIIQAIIDTDDYQGKSSNGYGDLVGKASYQYKVKQAEQWTIELER